MRANMEHHVTVGCYVLMPVHVHLFVAGDRAFWLGCWVGLLKQSLAKAIARPRTADPVWHVDSSITSAP
jgi:hypothetical protein